MPQVTVYVRNEDIAKWKAIERKTEFIHSALNGSLADLAVVGQHHLNKVAKKEKLPPIEVIKTKEDAAKAITQLKQSEPITYKKTNNWGA